MGPRIREDKRVEKMGPRVGEDRRGEKMGPRVGEDKRGWRTRWVPASARTGGGRCGCVFWHSTSVGSRIGFMRPDTPKR